MSRTTINISQLPASIDPQTYVVVSQVAQTALSAQVGDIAVRTDISKTYTLQTLPASTFANWIEHLSAGGAPGAHASTHISIGSDPIPDATTSQDGLMSPADKTSLTNATSSPTVSTLVKRDGSARFQAVDPISAQDVATKTYVDAVAHGLDPKGSCRVATLVDTTLSGLQTIDGVSVAAGERVLVKAQTLGQNNGIYVVAVGAWSRSSDAATSADVTSGMFTFISEGTTNASSGWTLITADPIVLGTTVLVFTQTSGAGQITAGAGLTKTGNTLDVVSSNGGIVINPNDVALTVANASLTIAAGGVKISDGTAGQVVVANGSGIPVAQTLSGDVSSVSGSGVVTMNGSFIRADGSVTFTAAQSMGSHKLTNVTDPTSAQDAATKFYVDGLDVNNIKKNGSVSFTGDQSMGSHKLTNVTNPTSNQDAATKFYVDSAVSTVTAKTFPLWGVVYVDLSAAILFAQGILAYTTLAAAYTSWRPGGAAYVAYGAPSATNPATIIVGLGVFAPAGTITHDVPYLTVVGATNNAMNHEISSSIAGPVFDITVDNSQFRNLRVSNLNGSGTAFRANSGVSVNGIWDNIDGSSSTGSFLTGTFIENSIGIIAGTFNRCTVYQDVGHGNTIRSQGNMTATWNDLTCVFDPGIGGVFLNGPTGVASTCTFNRLTFKGGPSNNTAFFNGSGTDFSGTINGIDDQTGGMAFVIRANGGAQNGKLYNIQNNFTTNGFFSGEAFVGVLENSHIVNTFGNGHAITIGSNARINNNRLIGNGTGLAISGGAVTIEAGHNYLRMPTGDTPGTSVSATILNSVSNPFNSELLAVTAS